MLRHLPSVASRPRCRVAAEGRSLVSVFMVEWPMRRPPRGFFALLRIVVLLTCWICPAAADRGYEKKQAKFAAEARERAMGSMRDALHFVEDLEKREAEYAASREVGADWRLRTSGRQERGENPRELLSRLQASLSATGNSQAVQDLQVLMRDVNRKSLPEASAAAQSVLAAEAESQALREESLRELQQLHRGGDGVGAEADLDQAQKLQDSISEEALTSPMASEGLSSSSSFGSGRLTRRSPVRSVGMLQLARQRAKTEARKRRRGLDADHRRAPEGRDDVLAGLPVLPPSMASGLADVTSHGSIHYNEGVQSDLEGSESMDGGKMLEVDGEEERGSRDNLWHNDDMTCRSHFECRLPKFAAGCPGGACKCEGEQCVKFDATDTSCTPFTAEGCPDNKICVQHNLKPEATTRGTDFFTVCEERIASAYGEEARKSDADLLNTEIHNMEDKRGELANQAKTAYDHMKKYHEAIAKLKTPLDSMKNEADKAIETYEQQIDEHEKSRTDPLQTIGPEEGVDSLLQELTETLKTLE